jgi:hypothetical protein
MAGIANRAPISTNARSSQPGNAVNLYSMMRFDSFFNVWYWIATTGIWIIVCWRTLGVPHALMLAAAREDAVAAEEAGALSRFTARRLEALRQGVGPILAGLGGFGLAVLAVLGFGLGVEVALAAFMLVFPLALVGIATLALARDVAAGDLTGEALWRRLGRRRMWNQMIAVLSMLAAAIAGILHYAATLGM